MSSKARKGSSRRDAFIYSPEFFRTYAFPKSQHPPQSTCQFTEVGDVFKAMFADFKVKPWPEFNKNASKVLVGRNAIPIGMRAAMLMDHGQYPPPVGEEALMDKFDRSVLASTNEVLNDLSSQQRWDRGTNIRLNSRVAYQKPDFRLMLLSQAGSNSATQSRSRFPDINGEMKTPCCRLGSHFTHHNLTRRIQHENALNDVSLRPVFQAFSYEVASNKGITTLSNYDETRFFKINIRLREILMSPVVKIEQRLDERTEIPHAMQAFLYAIMSEPQDEKEFSAALVQSLIAKGERFLQIKKEKEEAKKTSSYKKADGASSSKDRSTSGKAKKKSDDFFPAVSLALQRCKVIELLGRGITGDVNECDSDGQRVAVKVGWKRSVGSRDRDCVQHVDREIDIYGMLKDLQGSVIPRVIESGLDPVYSTGMVLITEKVGMKVDWTERKIVVGGTVLDRENLLAFNRKEWKG